MVMFSPLVPIQGNSPTGVPSTIHSGQEVGALIENSSVSMDSDSRCSVPSDVVPKSQDFFLVGLKPNFVNTNLVVDNDQALKV